MGQRTQCFIKIHNPLLQHNAEIANAEKYEPKNKIKLAELHRKENEYISAFGKDSSTILVFHHQWCYGRSLLIACSNVLSIAKNATEYNNPFIYNPYCSADEKINSIQHILSLFNSRLAYFISRVGLEKFSLLNFSEPEIRTNFSIGDNNDGIIIIDSIEHKYAFLNIGGDSTINQIPKYEPISAERYVKLYYPECEEDSQTAIPPADVDFVKYWTNNRRMNKLFVKDLASFKILSKDEIELMFPEMNFIQKSN